MNALFLAAAMVVVFAFGYRFYAKWLALDVFRLDQNYSPPAEAHADGHDFVPTHRHLLAGHHLAAVTGATVFAGPIVAAGWGWVPAFLWITAATAVAGGTYGLGALWLSARHPNGLALTAARFIGPWARTALALLTPIALLILIAAAAGLSASLLAAHPGAVLPVAAVALLAVALGSFLHGRSERALLPACAAALALALLAVWVLGAAPLALDGALAITLAGRVWFEIDAVVVWVVLLLVYAVYAARLPVWRLVRPRGFLTSLLLLVSLIAFYVALAVARPLLQAPEFHASPSGAGSLPWLFLTVGAGAIAGWQLFIVHGVTARELRRETDARYVGFGGGLVQGFAALSALLLAATAFAGRDEWTAYFAAPPSVANFPQSLALYVDAYARLVAPLGIDSLYARHLAATVLAALSLAVLEAAVRALMHFSLEVAPPTAVATPDRRRDRSRLWLVAVVAGVLALHDGRGFGGIAAWPVLALTSLWIAALGFALMGLAARARGHAAAPLGVLAMAGALVATAASGALLWWAWTAGAWVAFAANTALLLLAAAVLREIARSVRHPAGALTDSRSNA